MIEKIKELKPCSSCRKNDYCGTPCTRYKKFIEGMVDNKEVLEFLDKNPEKMMEVFEVLSR